jgi:hypothetical protein
MPARSLAQGSGRLEVTIGREIARLPAVRAGTSGDDAVASGVLVRRKVEGIWLYAAEEEHIDRAIADVLAGAHELCREWLLAAMRILAGKVAKDSGSVTMEAVRPILRFHVRAGTLQALPALTGDYDPHLLLFDPDDADEIALVLSDAKAALASQGCVAASSLADPGTPRTSRAWRYAVIAHLEWLGLGSDLEGTLHGWAAQ